MSNKSNMETLTPEEELTQEEQNTLLRTYEDDILGGLLAAADFRENKDEIHPVEVVRDGVLYIKFHIRPLSEEEYFKCKEKHTTFVRNRQLGTRVPERVDTNMYRNALIYEATTAEDRAKIWDNKEAWKKLNVLNGKQLIGLVLKAGEKDAILDRIDEISGYSTTMEETAKN
jgi:hypothetical protein